MDIRTIISELKAERERIDKAIAALEGHAAPVRRRAGAGASPVETGVRRHMSAAARKRIAATMKRRWAAKHKKAEPKGKKKGGYPGPMFT